MFWTIRSSTAASFAAALMLSSIGLTSANASPVGQPQSRAPVTTDLSAHGYGYGYGYGSAGYYGGYGGYGGYGYGYRRPYYGYGYYRRPYYGYGGYGYGAYRRPYYGYYRPYRYGYGSRYGYYRPWRYGYGYYRPRYYGY